MAAKALLADDFPHGGPEGGPRERETGVDVPALVGRGHCRRARRAQPRWRRDALAVDAAKLVGEARLRLPKGERQPVSGQLACETYTGDEVRSSGAVQRGRLGSTPSSRSTASRWASSGSCTSTSTTVASVPSSSSGAMRAACGHIACLAASQYSKVRSPTRGL